MTYQHPPSAPPKRRMVGRDQVAAGALAGLTQGVALAVLAGALGIWLAGGWSRPVSELLGWAFLTVTLVLLAGAWVAGTALLRRRGLVRARSIVSWSLALSVVIVGVAAVAIGWIALIIGFFSAIVVWSGEYTGPIAVTAVIVVAAIGLLVGTSTCLLFTVLFADPPPVSEALRAGAPTA